RVGQNTFDLRSTIPLLVRPVTPRFFVVDDEVVLSSVVNNNTGEEQAVTAFIDTVGLSVVDPNTLEQTQTIPDGGRARFEWRVRAENVETADVTFFATNADGTLTDASKSPVGLGDDRLLPVYRFDVPETVGTAGVVREGGERTEGVALPTSLDVGGGTLTVNVDTSLASVTLDGLDYLRNFPHQCTEQTVSRFLPNIITYQALASLDLDDPALQNALDEQVEIGLQILNTRQNIDGGFGWFSRDRSNTLVTAYVLMGLIEAQEAGYPVSEMVLNGTVAFLRNNLPLNGVPPLGGQDWQYDREAFVLYTLSRAGQPDLSREAILFEVREHLSAEGRAFLAMAMHTADSNDPRTGTLLSDVLSVASTSASGTFWSSERNLNWSTQTRATSVILEMLIQMDPDSELIPNVVRYLVSARTADRWETTQETAWAVMSLTDWMVASNELNAAYDYTVSVNGEGRLEATTSFETAGETQSLTVDVLDLLVGEVNEITFDRTSGDGNLYY
ncbi:MAG: hypothetical protein AAF125_21765, partial [Chloroflexota bacterium]